VLWPRWIWLRALGLIFLSAFYSLAFQIEGLNGPRGILPAGEYLPEVRAALGPLKALWYAPTLFWLTSSDGALMTVVLTGALARYKAQGVWGTDPVLPEAGFDRLRRALLGSGFLSRAVPFAECVDNRLAEQAVAAG